jgi:dipeptidyl aminopeptidase/acylaminoacyl peptidase
MYRSAIIFFISCFSYLGCSPLPCKPPSYYAPDPSAPVTAHEVRVPTKKGHLLAGTLTIPSHFPSPHPAVVLITGSHPQDRDMVGQRTEPVNRYRPFKQMAETLSRRGVAVLRMDDRGYGCSEGDDINEATIPERADDIQAGLAFLQDRKEIDAHRLGLVGISEGANIGLLIAASDPSIHALVTMAGSASTGKEILEWQVRYDTARIEGITEEARGQILVQRMQDVEDWIAEGRTSRWRRSFVEYNPLQTASDVLCPVLILHGDRDANVPVEHAHLLANAMRTSGNTDVTVKVLPDYNHLFLKDADGRFTNKRYLKLLRHTNQLSEEILTIVADWVSSRLEP